MKVVRCNRIHLISAVGVSGGCHRIGFLLVKPKPKSSRSQVSHAPACGKSRQVRLRLACVPCQPSPRSDHTPTAQLAARKYSETCITFISPTCVLDCLEELAATVSERSSCSDRIIGVHSHRYQANGTSSNYCSLRRMTRRRHCPSLHSTPSFG